MPAAIEISKRSRAKRWEVKEKGMIGGIFPAIEYVNCRRWPEKWDQAATRPPEMSGLTA